MPANKTSPTSGRWSLYRLLADPSRLRLLALAAEHELSVGELADLLTDSQPNVSRQALCLRQGGLLLERRQGTRSYLRLTDGLAADPVVCDALAEGQRLCRAEGRLARIESVLRSRGERVRETSEPGGQAPSEPRLAAELPIYLAAVAAVSVDRRLAIDIAVGSGDLLDVLAPFFVRVIAMGRDSAQLKQVEERVARRGYRNVELVCGEFDDREVSRRFSGHASAVFATRALHHAIVPKSALATMAALLAPGGEMLILDYASHEDVALQSQHGDIWRGFSKTEMLELVSAAGLVSPKCFQLHPGLLSGGGADSHLPWQLVCARRPVIGV